VGFVLWGGRDARRAAALLLAALTVLVPAGCSSSPPQSCDWSGTPGGITSADLVGEFHGTAADGQPVSLTLAADGQYRSTNLQLRDWYSGTWLPVTAAATWTLVVDHRWYDRVSRTPPPAHIRLTDDYKTEFEVGGTRADPVLYDVLDHGDSCAQVRSLLRQS
jgi:hypothetical protein